MSKAKDDYYEFKQEADSHHEGLCDRSYEYIKELEEEKAELLLFVTDIAYNDINDNDLKIGWVQEKSWALLNKHKENV
jgi:hypothetical protein